MPSKFQPSEDMFDDAEGHAVPGEAVVPEDDDDVEGHTLKSARPILPGERGRAGRTHDR